MPNRFGGLEIDHELEGSRLLNGQISRLGAAQNLDGHLRALTEDSSETRTIGLVAVMARKLALPGIGHVLAAGRELVAPGIFGAVEPATRGEFPFRLGRQVLASPSA